MRINKKDFVIIQNEKGRKLLCQVFSVNNKIKGKLEDIYKFTNQCQILEFTTEDVLACLGPEPEPGSVHGIKVAPYYKQISIKPFGQIFYRRLVTDNEDKIIVNSLKECGTVIRERNLVQKMPIETEIRHPVGKYAGTYKWNSSDEKLDLMVISPKVIDGHEMKYVIFHELGHYVWFNLFDKRQKVRWIKAYHKNVLLSRIGNNKLNQLKEDFKNEKTTINNFKSDLEEDDQILFSEILQYIKKYHKIDIKDLDTLISDGEDVTTYWPDKVELCNQEDLVSEYSKKSTKELFAEAFSFYLTDQKLPDNIKEMVERDLKIIKKL